MALNKSKIGEKKLEAKPSGFTLVETLVAMAIFSMIVGAALGIFVTGVRSQRKVLASQQVLDQTSYVLEYMSRALRMAKKDLLGNCIAANSNYALTGSGIKFKNYKNECQEFYLESGQLKESKNGGSGIALTSSNLTVNYFGISSSGWLQTDNIQPSVTIFLDVIGKEQAGIKIQTAVSQRNLDVAY
jgi:prepilin-type N-terminal cleavage/methylation domain-containing protein